MGPRVSSFGDGVLRDVITSVATRRLSGDNSPLHEGYDNYLYWQPRVLSAHLQPTAEQVEDAFVDGAVIGLQLLHCQSYPGQMVPLSLLVHLAGTTSAFTRDAASELLPDFLEAVDNHRRGVVQSFAQLCLLHLNIPVSRPILTCAL